ncbi:hypothetical protein JCM11491_005021 [Sporobolomyces phaffii]
MSPRSTPAILARLQEIRTTRVRAPLEVFQLGERLVESGWIHSPTPADQGAIVKEQLATAATECGQLELAAVLIDRLSNEFGPDAQRVVALKGILLEARGQLDLAHTLYTDRLRDKETDVLIRKRLIALHLSTPVSSSSSTTLSRQEGIRLLVEYLDTTYVDAEAWLLLSKSYAEIGLYEQSLSSLNHAVLLQPQNPFLLLQHAELAYTIGHFALALREALRVIEMTTPLEEGPPTTRRLRGCGQRAAFTAKSCISRLGDPTLTSTSPPKSKPKSTTTTTIAAGAEADDVAPPPRAKLDELDLVVTRLILESYSAPAAAASGTSPGEGRHNGPELGAVREWVGTSA